MGEVIGAGAFGTVFSGQYMGADVAVKLVPMTGTVANPTSEMNTLRYATANCGLFLLVFDTGVYVRNLRHPNIVYFFGFTIHSNHLLMVTELVLGADLDRLIFKDKV